ncbi:hypothetical protein BN159_7669 [Streptomyces davaonensis JCM 4913]|uniref:Uncharacterized protein n=1 Tax=Streptomyces davaonensis (strain DSM 101723 / JCM 4913 / KCC S-0913 / 768) TaxID=1214101 RepID=K4RE60_STRDJ|nr:hypothetical protein BN159_7669 [Streptomyces davaonensis JCM 4913]
MSQPGAGASTPPPQGAPPAPNSAGTSGETGTPLPPPAGL